MMERRGSVIVVCGHGIADPLVCTLMLDYALRLQEQEGDRAKPMLFFTEEDGGTAPDAYLLARMQAARITWAPLAYRVAGPQFLQRLRNTFAIVAQSRRFAKGKGPSTVIGFLSMAGSYASVLRTWVCQRFMLVSFEPHSLYMVELGVWPKGSFKARLAAWFERRQVRNADFLIAPTRAAVAYAKGAGSRARIAVQGVTIDVAANARRTERGMQIRTDLGLEGKVVLAYAGKFNGLYYSEAQYVRFMADTCRMDARVHHLVVTFPEHAHELRKHAARQDGLETRFTLVDPVPPEELPDHLSAADIGVLAVPPTPSQVFRTPVKSALYWAAGLPLLIPEGISDDWWIVRDRQLGLVVPGLEQVPEEGFRALVGQMAGEDAEFMRARCVQAAQDLRSTEAMVRLLHEALSGEWTEQAAQNVDRLSPVQP